jgi:hypothetical protein
MVDLMSIICLNRKIRFEVSLQAAEEPALKICLHFHGHRTNDAAAKCISKLNGMGGWLTPSSVKADCVAAGKSFESICSPASFITAPVWVCLPYRITRHMPACLIYEAGLTLRKQATVTNYVSVKCHLQTRLNMPLVKITRS